MTLNPATVDRIVADVMASLRGGPPTRPSASPVVTPKPAFDLDLRHAGVVTGEMLDAARDGAAVAVAKRVVLTPSAREAVRRRSIVLRKDAAADAPKSASKAALLVVTSTPATRRLAEQLGWAADFPGCEGEAIAAARSRVCRGESDFVAVVAPGPHRTAQRLNRTRGVLAAAVTPETPAADVIGEGQWNVACLSADRWSPFAMRRTLEHLAGAAR